MPSTQLKLPTTTTFEPITLEHGVTHDPEIENWANLIYAPGTGGTISLKNFPKDIIIDVLPKALPVITGVRGWYGAPRGGVAQPAWQHRRASARLFRYAVAHGCSRRATTAAPSGHDRATRTASR